MSNKNIQLQLGDIIQLDAPNNNELHNKIFYIKFIDKDKIILVNEEKIITLSISEAGKLLEESIHNILLLYKQNNPSYVYQNNITINKNISIYFGEPLPKVINGIVTNIENDMIEITIIPTKEVIYIDFAYSGIPENLNIEKIIIRNSDNIDIQDKVDVKHEDNDEYKEDKENDTFLKQDDTNDLDYDIINYEYPVDEILSETFDIENEYEEFYHSVNVSDNEKRYTLEDQLNDYMDNMLNKYSSNLTTDTIYNKINLEINRYKELREIYSSFDDNNNPNIINTKGEFYKPLKETIINLNKKLYWLLPVTSVSKNIINNDEDLIDDEYIKDYKMGDFISELNSVINKWSNNTSKEKIYNYKKYIDDLLSIYDNNIAKYEEIDNTNKLDVNTSIHVINDIYDDYYSYVYKNNSIEKARFVIDIYSEGLNMLETHSVNNKKIFKSTKLTLNDKLTIISFMTLPLPIFNFSKINLTYTDICERSNLNNNFLNYYKLLSNNTNVNRYILDKPNVNTYINTHDTLHNNMLLNKVCNFSTDNSISQLEYFEKTNLLLESFIPTNSSLIKYLSDNKYYYNYKSMINDTQAMEIDIYGMSVKDTITINSIFTKNIDNYIKQNNTLGDIFKYLIDLINKEIINNKSDTKYNFDIFNKELKQELFENYKINEDLYNNTEELLNALIKIDNLVFFNTALNKNIMDLLVANLLDNFIKQKNKFENTQDDIEISDDTCEKYYLSKKYTSLDELENDNNKSIYFDAIYDTTMYSLVNEYTNEKQTLDSDNFFKFLTNILIEKTNLTKKKALREAKAIIEEKKEVIDGDYAVLINKEDNKNYIYKRENNIWVIDDSFKSDFYIDSNKILCNTNKECISSNDKCMDIKNMGKENLKNDVDKILENFQAKYNLSIEEIKGKINNKYTNAKKYLKNILYIRKIKDEYVNSEILKYFSLSDTNISDTIKKSPYIKLRDTILGVSDFVKKQDYIKKFCINFSRNAINDEDVNWLYCNKTNTKLIPLFLMKLANAYSNKLDYLRELDTICANQGTISDDGNYWVDKHSGYIIKNIEFSNDEGYDSQGYKLNTKELLEDDYSVNIKSDKYTSTNPDIKMILALIKSITQMLGINLDNHNEFIINNVIKAQQQSIPSKEQYEKLLLKNAKKTGKDKGFPSYEDTYNSSILLLTLSYLIVSIQISIPSIKSKKTFPGCIKSFSGYPLDNQEDKSTIVYISCIANKMKSSIKPWNTILKNSESLIVKKIEAIIEKYIVTDKKILDLLDKKREYLLDNGIESIPHELSIDKWSTFMPPLLDISVSNENKQPLDTNFKDSLIELYSKGKKNNIEEVIRSKIIYLSNSIIGNIQTIVSKTTPLLENNNGEAFLENACCNSTTNTINYFIKADKNIVDDNKLINFYGSIIENIDILNKSSILYHSINNKVILPKVKQDFSEITIYKCFIYYCNFNNNIPIDDELKSVCMDKPDDFDENNSIIDNINALKSAGKIYNKNSLLDLINIINKRNIFSINYNHAIINNTELLRILVKNYKDSMITDNIDEQLFNKLDILLDTYDIANTNNSELDNIKNYLAKSTIQIKKMSLDLIKKNTNLNKTNYSIIENFLNTEFNIYHVKFLQNYIQNLLFIFPNIILNKNINSSDIPKHWHLSELHNKDVANIISKYYSKLLSFTNLPELELVFRIIKNKCHILFKLSQISLYISPINVANSKDKLSIKSIFDGDFIQYLYSYIFNSIIYEYINISQNKYFLLEIGNYENYDETKLNDNIFNYIYEFVNIMENHYNLLNNSYNKIKEKVIFAKEKEKDLITSYLKELTDEEREVENIFKANKLEGWSMGLKKGITQYVAENYDAERIAMEKQAAKEKKLNQNNNVTEMNKEIYKMDLEQDEQINQDIENEEFNMNNIPDDDDISSDYEEY